MTHFLNVGVRFNSVCCIRGCISADCIRGIIWHVVTINRSKKMRRRKMKD